MINHWVCLEKISLFEINMCFKIYLLISTEDFKIKFARYHSRSYQSMSILILNQNVKSTFGVGKSLETDCHMYHSMLMMAGYPTWLLPRLAAKLVTCKCCLITINFHLCSYRRLLSTHTSVLLGAQSRNQ